MCVPSIESVSWLPEFVQKTFFNCSPPFVLLADRRHLSLQLLGHSPVFTFISHVVKYISPTLSILHPIGLLLQYFLLDMVTVILHCEITINIGTYFFTIINHNVVWIVKVATHFLSHSLLCLPRLFLLLPYSLWIFPLLPPDSAPLA